LKEKFLQMKRSIILGGLLIAFGGFGPMQATSTARTLPTWAQQDEDVRGAFLTTRPKASDKSNKPGPNTKPNRRRPKPNPVASTDDKKPIAGTPGKARTQRLGLGLTLFKRDSNGLGVRADPTRVFRKGDRVRVLLETNADGYLYIFNTTDAGEPVMIYPDPELDEAGNYVQAHVPFEIPSSAAAEERLRWFAFDQYPGTEKIYFVFSREPLFSVPIEDDLLSFCRDNSAKCPWHPGAGVWAQVTKELTGTTKIAKAEGLGNAQTSGECQAATRGIGLNRDDPEPSLIMLTSSTDKNILVTTLELVHGAVAFSESSAEEPE
jgi:uncharacterized protein DUF4384